MFALDKPQPLRFSSSFALPVLGVVLAAGCPPSAGTRDGGGVDRMRDGTSEGQTDDAPAEQGPDLPVSEVGSSCDPAMQNCPMMTQRCFFKCPEAIYMCAPEPWGGRKHGEECMSREECEKSANCFKMMAAGADGGERRVCRRYCNSNSDCPMGKACGESYPVCMMGGMMPGTTRICEL